MARRPRDAEATRRDILDAAQKRFSEKGFGSTSLAEIGRDCGCATSLIVHHFGSKEALWSTVKDRAFSGFVEERSRLYRDRPVSLEDLKDTTEAYFRLLQRHPQLVQLLIRAELEHDLATNRFNTEQLAPFVERMREAQQAGLLRDDVPAAHVLLIVINVITRWFEARHMFRGWDELAGKDMDDQFLESVKRVIFGGAVAPGGQA